MEQNDSDCDFDGSMSAEISLVEVAQSQVIQAQVLHALVCAAIL